jgi:hypothetical protein
MLWLFKYVRTGNNERIREGFKPEYIVPVSPGYDQGQGHARSVGGHRDLAAVFSPASGVFPDRFLCQRRFGHTAIGA